MSDQLPGHERPQNFKRSAFHAGWGLFAVWLASSYLSPLELTLVSGSFTVIAWGLELLKRTSARGARLFELLFNSITHKHEADQINSATWYCSAVFVSTLLFEPVAIIGSVLCLAVGDPIAGIVGRSIGRVKLIGRRTLEGTLAFTFSATLATWALLSLQYPSVTHPVLIALAGGGSAALAELLSGHWLDDNVSVPLTAAAGISLSMSVLG